MVDYVERDRQKILEVVHLFGEQDMKDEFYLKTNQGARQGAR